MKLALITIILFVLSKCWADDNYYIQLIKATNEPDPPQKGARAVGSKLGEKLSPLRWKHYWETERRDITIKDQKPAKVQLTEGRTVEVVPASDTKVEVRLYRGKNLARKSCHKAHDRMMAIFGGDEGQRAWFIVVRREEPQYHVAKH